MELGTFHSKIKYIVIAIVILLACILIYQVFLTLGSVLTEGNPSVGFAEINDTIAVSGNISHLSDQEYQDFPGLKKVIENQKTDISWNNGYRYLGSVKISEQQRATIYEYIKNIDLNDNYLEYGGKYFRFSITLS